MRAVEEARRTGRDPEMPGHAVGRAAAAGSVTAIVTGSGHAEAADRGQLTKSALGSRENGMSQPCGRQRALARAGCETASARLAREPDEAERGSLTLMLAVLFVALIAMAGIVVDGGTKLSAAENATSIAQEAARAGAGMVSRSHVYTGGGFVVDWDQADQAATQYLQEVSAVDHVSSFNVARSSAAGGQTRIAVSVTISQPTKVLSIIDIDTITVTGHATAELAAGVTGPGQ